MPTYWHLSGRGATESPALTPTLNRLLQNQVDIGDAIGEFLATANPYWNKADMASMMEMHITQTIAYANDALTGDYTKAITDYGVAERHMQEMSDMLAAGLTQQFR